MASADSALVLKRGVPAATLTNAGGTVSFSYLEEYLASSLPAIATSLPKTTRAQVLTNGATPAFFAGLLPEGRRLNAIASRLKTSTSNEIALLIELGADPIGDVQVVDPKAQSRPSTAISIPRNTSKLDFRELRDRHFDSAAAGLPGLQDKISSKMLNAPAKTQGLEYILKFNPDDVPNAVENEHLMLKLAKSIGLRTADFQLLTDQAGRNALLLQRFDRSSVAGDSHRYAMEDGCQVLNLYPSQKYELAFEDLANALIDLCSARKIAALELLKQLAFDYLIGNGDAHAKNFSALQLGTGEWRISPAYDLLCTAYYGDKDMALSLGGGRNLWDRSLLINFGEAHGVPSELTNKLLDDMIAKTATLIDALVGGALLFRRDQNYEVAKFLKSRQKHLAV